MSLLVSQSLDFSSSRGTCYICIFLVRFSFPTRPSELFKSLRIWVHSSERLLEADSTKALPAFISSKLYQVDLIGMYLHNLSVLASP